MHRTGDTGVEGVDSPENLKRLLGICNRSSDKRVLHGALLAFRVCGAQVPRRRNDLLIVLDLALFDIDPMAERATSNIVQAEAYTVGALIQFVLGEGPGVRRRRGRAGRVELPAGVGRTGGDRRPRGDSGAAAATGTRCFAAWRECR